MMADLLLTLGRMNLAAAAAILLVLALRVPVRRRFGAQAAYALWLIAPLAAGASLLPALHSISAAEAKPGLDAALERLPLVSGGLLVAWLVGAAVLLSLLAASQKRFLRRAARGEAGPAIVGVIDPRLILPSDFSERFSPEEQALIRAHERVHMDRDDPRANAVLAVLQCLNWFNPLVHLAARAIRLDQELACDAAVVARYPKARRRYAETMLKTSLSEGPLPIGCQWLAGGRHPLEARIALLKDPTPSARRQLLGMGLITLVALSATAMAWLVQPARIEEPVLARKAPAAVMNILILR